MYAPDWQTEELAEEWVEDSDSDNSESDLSLTKPIAGSFFVTPDRSLGPTENEPDGALVPAGGTEPSSAVGTFVVREDQPPPVLPKTPGKGGVKFGNDMFTPLKLERMFEPPSPPQQQQQQATTSSQSLSHPPPAPIPSSSSAPLNPSPLSQCFVPSPDPTTTSQLRRSSAQSVREPHAIDNDGEKEASNAQKESSDEIVETDIPNVSFNGRRPSMHGQFTFHMPPRGPPGSLHPNSAGPSPMPSSATPSPFASAPSGLAGVQSTPKHPNLLDKATGKSATAAKPLGIATPMTGESVCDHKLPKHA